MRRRKRSHQAANRFVVTDSTELAYVYFEDEARRIAANLAKRPLRSCTIDRRIKKLKIVG
jgi:hypothetical protein